MATIDTHRAAYQRPNSMMPVGKREPSTPTPTVTVEEKVFYTVKLAGKTRSCNTIAEVNAILAVNNNISVVKTTRKVTTEVRHKRIR